MSFARWIRVGAASLALACFGCGDEPSGSGPVQGDFALSVSPTALTIVPGMSSSRVSVDIDRTNFTEGVTLSLRNPPAGFSGAFSPSLSTNDESGLVLSVAGSVSPGSYTLTIQGAANVLGVRSTTLTITVPALAAGNVVYVFCHAEDVPVFFAYQDGSGAWQAVTGTTSGSVTSFGVNLTQGRGGVLSVYAVPASAAAHRPNVARRTTMRRASTQRWGLPRRMPRLRNVPAITTAAPSLASLTDAYETYTLFGSTVDLAQDGLDACVQELPTKTLSATLAGVPAGAYGIVSLGGPVRILDGTSPNTTLTFDDVPSGSVDLVATRTTPGNAPDRAIVIRNLNLPDGGALPSPLDFNGSGTVVPATATATITGGAGDDLEIFTDLITANGQMGMWSDLAPTPDNTRPWAGLSTAAMMSNDFHGLFVFASEADGTGDFRFSLKYVGPVADQTLILGSPLSVPAASLVAAGAYPRFRFQGTLPTEYNKGVSIDMFSPEESGNFFGILATGAYLAASGSAQAYDITMPDVAGLAGFPAAARLTAGANEAVVDGFGFSGQDIFHLRPVLGGEFRAANRHFALSVP